MALDPSLVTAPRLPVQPIKQECPGDFIAHKTSCFKFGSHSSYEMAQTACESAGAGLADVESTYIKYIRDQVRILGGNEFWIGSFESKGKVYRQKGRTSCPIIRGQVLNEALYRLGDCNSAKPYICQKYGRNPTENPFSSDTAISPNLNLASTTTATDATTTKEASGETSPVIYVIVTVVVIIMLLIAIKVIMMRYCSNKNKNEEEQKTQKSTGTGPVFSPKWRKDMQSKLSSVDSAVPPSNPSPSLEKSVNPSNTDSKLVRPSSKVKKTPGEDITRMGRPRVNGPQPTRKPPHLDGDVVSTYHSRTVERQKKKGREENNIRRTYSDPRSDYGFIENERDAYPSRRRRSSYYSDKTLSSSDSDFQDGGRFGPAKVYQRYPSENRLPSYGEAIQHYQSGNHYDSHYGRGSHGRNQRRRKHSNFYHNDGNSRSHSRHHPHTDHRYGHYDRHKNQVQKSRGSRVPTVSLKVAQPKVQERQYFPQPHRLMSWVDPDELKDLSAPAQPLNRDGTTLSFQNEPIWVNRHIYQSSNHKSKRSKSQVTGDHEEPHIYESLDEVMRGKHKKSRRKNRQRKRGDVGVQ